MKLAAVVFTAMVALTTVNGHFLPPFGKGPLYEDIQYFMDMIPMEEVVNVVLEYAADDAEFQAMLQYFGTQEFKDMIQEIENIPEFKVFATYLQQHDVYIYDSLNKLNKVIGIPPFHKVFANSMAITGGVKGLFTDVKALISYDKFIHGYVYKMRVSDAFRDFVAHLKSPNHQQFVNHLYENVNFLRFRGMLVREGIDVALIEDIIYTVLGIEFPIFNLPPVVYASDQLAKDIRDFIKLIDMDKIMEIVLSYLEDDQVQGILEYFYGEEFHALVRVVEALPEYQDLVLYLDDAGLDVVGLIQNVHKLLGMEDYVPPKHNLKQRSMQTFSNLGGIKGLLDAVIAALPMEQMRALFREKMQTSPAFKNFIEKLRSEEFQHIVQAIYDSPIFLEMRQKVIDAGLDIEPAKKLIEIIIGAPLPVPPLF